jgi:hypothetical protein
MSTPVARTFAARATGLLATRVSPKASLVTLGLLSPSSRCSLGFWSHTDNRSQSCMNFCFARGHFVVKDIFSQNGVPHFTIRAGEESQRFEPSRLFGLARFNKGGKGDQQKAASPSRVGRIIAIRPWAVIMGCRFHGHDHRPGCPLSASVELETDCQFPSPGHFLRSSTTSSTGRASARLAGV